MLELRTLIVGEELFGGAFRTWPIAGPRWVSQGDTLAACMLEQRLFLEEYLAGVAPEEIARYSLPEGTSLLEIRVEVSLPGDEDMPRRLRRKVPLVLPAFVIPQKTERWIFVPAVDLTFHLEAKGDLEPLITSEVSRLLDAREPTAAEIRDFVPRGAPRLLPLELRIKRGPSAGATRGKERRKLLQSNARRADALAILASVAQPIHEQPEAGKGPALAGREKELEALGALLSGKDRRSVLLIGPELCGKTALLHGWLRTQKERLVFGTSGSQLIAGMSGLGQWQERVERVMRAAEDLDAILYFENLGDLLAEHAGGYIDIPAAMKRWLSEGKVRVLGELASGSLDTLERRHPGFLSAMSRFPVRPLDAAVTREALHQRIDWFSRTESQRPNLDHAAVDPLIDLTERYLPYRALPGKAVRLFDELRAVHQQDGKRLIDAAAVRADFSARSGIPEWLLRDDRALLAETVRARFESELAGQREAIARVVETLCVVKADLQPRGKPLSTMLFIGPTGVGKTELARLLAAFLFGSADRLFRFDMSEYMDPYAAERLIRGTDRSDGALTRKVRQQPFCVVLLDEIEKAHPAVFDLLLQLAGEGRLTDARGRTAFFHNAIIILTSNLGAANRRAPIRVGEARPQEDAEHYLRAVRKAFRPELVNRLDQIVPFHALGEEETRKVAELVVRKVRTRRGLRELQVSLHVQDDALAALAREGHDAAFGGRAMRRHVERALVAPLARALAAAGAESTGALVEVSASGLSVQPRPHAEGRGGLAAIEEVQQARREIARLMTMDRVESVRDRLAFITAQLAQTEGPDRGHGLPGVRELHEEHHRLAAVYDKARKQQDDANALEEVALEALLAAESTAALAAEARALMQRFRESFVYLLLCQEPRRDEVCLLVQEVDAGAFEHWLAPLLENAPERGWEIVLHLDGDSPPAGRRWGPARAAKEVLPLIGDEKRKWRNVLLRARGPYAGVLLALDAGLQRYPGKREPSKLLVFLIEMRFELTSAELADDRLVPLPPPAPRALQATPAIWDFSKQWKASDPPPAKKGLWLVDVDLPERWQRLEELSLAAMLLLDRAGVDASVKFKGRLDQR